MIPPAAVDIPAAAAARAAAAVKQGWRAGGRPDAAAALRDHPFLLHFKSLVVDLAYEEYCLREERGAAPDPAAFARRLPAYRSSVLNVLQAHRLVADHPELLAAAEVDWPARGSEVEGLTIRAELGRGSFARAYLAYDPGTDRDCVLKLSPSRGGEGRALGPLSHPHITDVYWARRSGGLNAVCMPLVGTVTLEDVREDVFWGAAGRTADLILDRAAAAAYAPAGGGRPVVRRGEPYPVGVAAMAARVAGALAYLHARGREHGDLKPSNVVVGPGGRPYLIDFNLAAPTDDRTGAAGGTVPFMAPERLRALAAGEPAPADAGEADVFALGVTTFALLTGEVPWPPAPGPLDPRAAAADQLARRAAAPAPRWPSGAGVPGPLAAVVDGCLAPDAAARPPAREVAAALDGWVAGRRTPRRGWRGFATVGLLVVAAVAVVGWPPRPAAPAAAEPEPEPRTAEDFIQRARQTLREKPAAAATAAADFEQAVALGGGPRALAYAAYGHTAAGSHPLAIGRAREAIAAGAGTAGVYTNLGWSLLQTSRPADALEALDEAVRLDPGSVPARNSRALARFRAARDADGRLPDLGCVEDMQVVLATGPDAAEVYFQAARMWASSAHLDPALRDAAVALLEAAARHGDNPARYADEPAFAPLAGHPGFEQACRLPQAGTVRTVNLRVVDPDPR